MVLSLKIYKKASTFSNSIYTTNLTIQQKLTLLHCPLRKRIKDNFNVPAK